MVASRVQVVAECGINHNGDIEIIEQMICHAAAAGCDFVKFQTRTLSAVYTPEEMAEPRKSPWGETVGDYRRARELKRADYEVINALCMREGIKWTTTCTDVEAVERMIPFDLPYWKIASPQLTDNDLIDAVCATGRPIVLSTGMSSMNQISAAQHRIKRQGNDLTLLHCTSTYPCQDDEINLRCMDTLKRVFGIPVGFSSHSRSILPLWAAAAMGAVMLEAHFTLDRSMFGSDQAWSLTSDKLKELVRGVRRIERCLGDGHKRVYDSELPAMKKLRRAGVTTQ